MGCVRCRDDGRPRVASDIRCRARPSAPPTRALSGGSGEGAESRQRLSRCSDERRLTDGGQASRRSGQCGGCGGCTQKGWAPRISWVSGSEGEREARRGRLLGRRRLQDTALDRWSARGETEAAVAMGSSDSSLLCGPSRMCLNLDPGSSKHQMEGEWGSREKVGRGWQARTAASAPRPAPRAPGSPAVSRPCGAAGTRCAQGSISLNADMSRHLLQRRRVCRNCPLARGLDGQRT